MLPEVHPANNAGSSLLMPDQLQSSIWSNGSDLDHITCHFPPTTAQIFLFVLLSVASAATLLICSVIQGMLASLARSSD